MVNSLSDEVQISTDMQIMDDGLKTYDSFIDKYKTIEREDLPYLEIELYHIHLVKKARSIVRGLLQLQKDLLGIKVGSKKTRILEKHKTKKKKKKPSIKEKKKPSRKKKKKKKKKKKLTKRR